VYQARSTSRRVKHSYYPTFRNLATCTLADTISKLTGLPTSILNDVRSITFGEWRFGAGKGVETVAVFAIGTGVGGGLVINGQLYLGSVELAASWAIWSLITTVHAVDVATMVASRYMLPVRPLVLWA